MISQPPTCTWHRFLALVLGALPDPLRCDALATVTRMEGWDGFATSLTLATTDDWDDTRTMQVEWNPLTGAAGVLEIRETDLGGTPVAFCQWQEFPSIELAMARLTVWLTEWVALPPNQSEAAP